MDPIVDIPGLMNPYGLAALLALIPLIIFYLTRPRPERKIMPSMRFFQEKDKDSKLQNALKKIRSNLLLLINILAISLFALALSEPYTYGSEADQTVIIYDRSASMIEDHAEAVGTVLDHSASETVVISASETVEVEEDLNRRQAADYVRDNPPGYHRSDMSAALAEALRYEGDILLLSNLDESQSVVEDYRDLGGERGLTQMDFDTENSWGFVGYDENSVEVRNFEDHPVSPELEVNDMELELEIPGRATETVEVNLTEGRNRLKLQDSGFPVDDELHLYMPEEEPVEVSYEGPENEYLETALETIETVELSESGSLQILNDPDAEASEPRILMQSAIEEAESEEKEVDFEEQGFKVETDVKNITAGENAFTTPESAVFVEEETGYYNVDDEDLRGQLQYPVVWRDIIHEIKEPATFETANHRVRLSEYTEPGFKNGEAAQFIDSEQSDLSFNNVEEDIDSSSGQITHTEAFAVLLLLLVAGETLIILNRGVYQ